VFLFACVVLCILYYNNPPGNFLLIKKKKLKTTMEEIRQQFLKQSAEFIAKWYQDIVAEKVTENSENTKKLGKEKLGEMKANLKDLTSKADTIANEFLSDSRHWWHLSPSDQGGHFPYEYGGNDNYHERIEKSLRYALGKVGPMLETYGYKVDSHWYEYTNYNPIKKVPHYPFHLEWSNEMKATLKNYSKMYTQAYQTYSEIKNLKKKKEEKEATDLWTMFHMKMKSSYFDH